MTTYTLRYIGDTARTNQNHQWVVQIHGDGQPMTFWPFDTLTEAVEKYPQVGKQADALDLQETLPEPTNLAHECLSDLITYTIPEILLNVERAALRGETLPADWYVRQLTDLEAEILAVL